MNTKKFNFDGIVTKYLEDEKIVEHFYKIAQADNSVLITGETGVGKELVARLIYANSKRSKKKFVAINCGSQTDTLLHSLLFGHKKGAFTSADRDHTGYFEEANGGTIFLDELCETSKGFQTSLLRVLENNVIRKVGDEKDIKINVRVLVACNKNIYHAVGKGLFREDLYYRLNIFQIFIPPLRDRIDDIRLLTDYFIGKFAHQYDKKIQGISDDAMKILLNHDWKGNVRELKNTLEYAVVMSDTETINPYGLPPRLSRIVSPFSIFHPDMSKAAPTNKEIESFIAEYSEESKHNLSPENDFSNPTVRSENLDFEKAKEKFEKQYLVNLLIKTKGNISEMAKLSNLNRKFIYRRLEQFGVSIDNYRNKF
ncbi:MAG: sigma-54 dependent transcriptional regulator [Candidatus Cloacimonetes bacterium]|nr:sigma-54 dependent transcriptional regulator [Candidatus Cloacimonadota bacterium]